MANVFDARGTRQTSAGSWSPDVFLRGEVCGSAAGQQFGPGSLRPRTERRPCASVAEEVMAAPAEERELAVRHRVGDSP